jgi:maleate isomerase
MLGQAGGAFERLRSTINPSELYDWIVTHSDAVFIGGNGFRSVGVIAALEEDLGRRS